MSSCDVFVCIYIYLCIAICRVEKSQRHVSAEGIRFDDAVTIRELIQNENSKIKDFANAEFIRFDKANTAKKAQMDQAAAAAAAQRAKAAKNESILLTLNYK